MNLDIIVHIMNQRALRVTTEPHKSLAVAAAATEIQSQDSLTTK